MTKQQIRTSEKRVLRAIAQCQKQLAPVNPTYREYANKAKKNVSWIHRTVAVLESKGLVDRPKRDGNAPKNANRGLIVITKRGQQVLEVVKRKSA